MTNNNNYRRLIWTTIAILVVVVVIFAVVVDFDSLLETLQGVNYSWLLLGLIFLLVGIVLISIRWRYFLRDKPSFLLTFHSNSVSYMLRLLIPVPLAVERLVIFSKTTSVDFYRAAPMMIIERFLELVMRLVALTLAVVVILNVHPWIYSLVILAILMLAVPIFIMWFSRNASSVAPRLIERSSRLPDLNKEKIQESMQDFQDNVSTMGATRGLTTGIIYSLGMWASFLIFYISGFYSLGLDLDFREIMVMSAAILVILPPSTPAMIAVYQGIIVAILLAFGLLDVTTATAYGILITGAQLVVWIILGIWGFKKTDLKLSKLCQFSSDEQDPSE